MANVKIHVYYAHGSSGVEVNVTFHGQSKFEAVIAETLAFGESPNNIPRQLADFFSKLK